MPPAKKRPIRVHDWVRLPDGKQGAVRAIREKEELARVEFQGAGYSVYVPLYRLTRVRP